MLNFSVGIRRQLGIRWRRFLANMFPLSFKILYDRGQLFWLTKYRLRYEFALLLLEQFQAVYVLSFWQQYAFRWWFFWVNGVNKGRVVLNLWPNNFSAGEVPFWYGCEFRDSITRKWYSESSFALLRVCLTVWMDLSAKPFYWL